MSLKTVLSRTGMIISALAFIPVVASASVDAHRLSRQTAEHRAISPDEPPDEPDRSRKFPQEDNSGPLVDANLQSLAPWIRLPPRPRQAFDQNGLPIMSLKDQLELRTSPINASMGRCACSIAAASPASSTAPLGQVSLKDTNGERFAVSVVSYDYALRLFQELDHKFVQPQDSIRDGCHLRAHKMVRYLENKGIASGKAMAEGLFQILSDRLRHGHVVWQFHVAPMIVVEEGTRRRVYVLDPALFAEPVPMESWLSLLVQHPHAQLHDAYLTNRYVFQPSESRRHITSWRPVPLLTAKNSIK